MQETPNKAHRVDWLIAATRSTTAATPEEPVVVREVFVVDAWTDDRLLRVVLRTPGVAQRDPTLVVTGTATLATAAQVARWRAAGTPLLLISNGIDRASLHGPTRVVSELAVLSAGGPRTPSPCRDNAASRDQQEDAPRPGA